jgi:hypothetical protein
LSAVTSADTRSDQLTILRPAGDAAGASSTPARTTTALTVILPCYNEAERLPGTLQTLLAHLSKVPGQVEVLVVDDGSTDATVRVAEAVAAIDGRIRVLSYHPNRGKGYAVRMGMLAAEGELIVFTDADGSYGPSQLARIVAALGEAPVAIGTRATDSSGPVAQAGGQPGLQPGDPRLAWAAVWRHARRAERLSAGGGAADLQPNPGGRLCLRCRGTVVGPPARAGGGRGQGPGHGAARQQGSHARRCPGDARRGVGGPAGEDQRRLRQCGSDPDLTPRSSGQPYRSAARSGELPVRHAARPTGQLAARCQRGDLGA